MALENIKQWLVDHAGLSATADEGEVIEASKRAIKEKLISHKQLGELLDFDIQGRNMETTTSTSKQTTGPSSKDVFGGAGPNVKSPSSRYKDTKYTVKHARTGLPVKGPNGREVESLSERELAKVGAFFKLAMKKNGVSVELTEHERELNEESFTHDKWAGEIGGQYEKDLSGMRVKASLLEDTTSGGVYLTPYFWDEAIVQFPLLFGELMPFVEIVDVNAGQEVRSASLQNPTVTWGTYSGTSITEFDNTALVGNIDQFIAPCTYATELSRDLLADTPITDLGGRVVQTVGMAALKEMDRVIAVGSGTNQPQGIFNQSAPTTINSTNGVGGPMTLGDYEALMFGIQKQYRAQQYRPCFVGNDASYHRARSMPIGPNDARRVLGEDEGSYNILSWPWRVQQDIPDNQVAFGALARYRLWRRQGQEVRLSDVGMSLMLKNTLLIVVRSRWAGQVVDGNGFIYMNDAATQ